MDEYVIPKSDVLCRTEESALFSGTARKSRFLAEFTLSDKQIPRFARNDKREGLGMTAPDPFLTSSEVSPFRFGFVAVFVFVLVVGLALREALGRP